MQTLEVTTVAVLIVYTAINFILAMALERKRNSVIVIFHTVLCVFTCLLLGLCSGNGVFATGVKQLLGEALYANVLGVANCSNVFVPFCLVELTLLLQGIVVMALVTRQIVRYLVAGSRKHQVEDVDDRDGKVGRTPPVSNFASCTACTK